MSDAQQAPPAEPQRSEPYLEPWMRDTHPDLDPLRRAVVHALELAGEDAQRHCADLNEEELQWERAHLPSVAFHLRHMVRSLDRLLTYAEARQLDERQMAALNSEKAPVSAQVLWAEVHGSLAEAVRRVTAVRPATYTEPRGIGRKRLPTTVGGLLIHCAEHTQRHAGQAVTTAAIVRAWRAGL